jgi:hypothetical protein
LLYPEVLLNQCSICCQFTQLLPNINGIHVFADILMVFFKLDPDITRWGLHHLLPGGASTTNAAVDFTGYAQPDDDTSVGISIEHVAGNTAVENDEIIAQALQEELSQIALTEASGASSTEDNRSAVLAQQWSDPRIAHVAASGILFKGDSLVPRGSRVQSCSLVSANSGNAS